ncbi:MAG: hypothetical protein ACR2PY_03345 [Salinispira sp.]
MKNQADEFKGFTEEKIPQPHNKLDSLDSSNPDKKEEKAHSRRLHRLATARWTIWGGMVVLAVLIIFHTIILVNNPNNVIQEVIRDGISVFATIVTLALGFIAGSNIE